MDDKQQPNQNPNFASNASSDTSSLPTPEITNQTATPTPVGLPPLPSVPTPEPSTPITASPQTDISATTPPTTIPEAASTTTTTVTSTTSAAGLPPIEVKTETTTPVSTTTSVGPLTVETTPPSMPETPGEKVKPKRKTNKKLVIGGVVGLVLATVVGILAYNLPQFSGEQRSKATCSGLVCAGDTCPDGFTFAGDNCTPQATCAIRKQEACAAHQGTTTTSSSSTSTGGTGGGRACNGSSTCSGVAAGACGAGYRCVDCACGSGANAYACFQLDSSCGAAGGGGGGGTGTTSSSTGGGGGGPSCTAGGVSGTCRMSCNSATENTHTNACSLGPLNASCCTPKSTGGTTTAPSCTFGGVTGACRMSCNQTTEDTHANACSLGPLNAACCTPKSSSTSSAGTTSCSVNGKTGTCRSSCQSTEDTGSDVNHCTFGPLTISCCTPKSTSGGGSSSGGGTGTTTRTTSSTTSSAACVQPGASCAGGKTCCNSGNLTGVCQGTVGNEKCELAQSNICGAGGTCTVYKSHICSSLAVDSSSNGVPVCSQNSQTHGTDRNAAIARANSTGCGQMDVVCSNDPGKLCGGFTIYNTNCGTSTTTTSTTSSTSTATGACVETRVYTKNAQGQYNATATPRTQLSSVLKVGSVIKLAVRGNRANFTKGRFVIKKDNQTLTTQETTTKANLPGDAATFEFTYEYTIPSTGSYQIEGAVMQ